MKRGAAVAEVCSTIARSGTNGALKRCHEPERRVAQGGDGTLLQQNVRLMTQARTLPSVVNAVAGTLARVRSAIAPASRLRVTGRLDHRGPGAHVVWTVANDGREPLTLTQLVVHDRHGSTAAVDIEPGVAVKPSQRVALATELDWSVLTARSIALIDIVGERHPLRHGELVRLRRQLHQMLQGSPPRSTSSARDWLYGSANLAFGMVILGLGLFMLLWVIATG